MFVLTVDQVGSRRESDAVPSLDEVDGANRALVGFDRTAGDEAQAVFDDAAAALTCALGLAIMGTWHCGIGQGQIDLPLPDTAREGRGSAFVNARSAVEAAKKSGSHHLGFVSDDPLGAGIQAALRVVVALRSKQRLTTREAYDLALEGGTQAHIAERLGISQQAVSDRLASGMYRELEDLKAGALHWAEALDRATLPGEARS
ncbi:hypothetical protein [Kocuria sp. HSID16901]|uniref:hypothetical protein n=1 Tax=Kocuria sp. HSID16901 TaxID=2419505 RepID=UPI0006618650|nr:hypothetical protein [Kocuria sp. HSID16901]RUQ22429.1 hypothetical protein D8M21_03000 [Kocuria sp. HSID16901]